VDGEDWFKVDQILNHRDRKFHVRKATKHTSKNFKLQREYLVKWRGYSDDHNTWEPAPRVAALDALKEYLAYRTRIPNPVALRRDLASSSCPRLEVKRHVAQAHLSGSSLL